MQTFGVVLGDGFQDQARCLEHWQRHVVSSSEAALRDCGRDSGKADVAVRRAA
jgi:hypothetical protein